MKNGTKVTHAELGSGTVVGKNKKWVNVSFDSGVEQMVFKNDLTKVSSNPASELASTLMNASEGSASAASLPVWSQIIEAADNAGHFASDIVEKALEGKRISEKQAYAVAFFANENNIK